MRISGAGSTISRHISIAGYYDIIRESHENIRRRQHYIAAYLKELKQGWYRGISQRIETRLGSVEISCNRGIFKPDGRDVEASAV